MSFTPAEVAAKSAFYNFRRSDPFLEDLSGESVFYKDESGQIFHTYSSFARGGEQFLGIYRYFDVMPKGRNENGPHHALPDWARLHDRYGKGGMVEPTGRFSRRGLWLRRPRLSETAGAPTSDLSRENAGALSRSRRRLSTSAHGR